MIKLKLKKPIVIGVAVVGIITTLGIGYKVFFAKDKVNFSTEAYEVAKLFTNKGVYKFNISISKNTGVVEVASDDSKSYKDTKKEASSSESANTESSNSAKVLHKNFSSSWTTADGLKKSEEADTSEQINLSISGITYSIEPLETSGTITLNTSDATLTGLKLLGYTFKDNTLYLDLSQTRQALTTSGNLDLIKWGKSLPDFGTVMKFGKGDLIIDNLYDVTQQTDISEFNYVTLRKELLRALSTVLNNSSKDLTKAGAFVSQDNKQYFTIDDSNRDGVVKTIQTLSEKSSALYDSYLGKLEKDSVVGSDTLSEKKSAKDTIATTNKDILQGVVKFIKDSSFQSVNWARKSELNGKANAELSLQARGRYNDSDYLLTITGDFTATVPETSILTLPTGAIEYKKALDTDEPIILSELIDKAIEVRSKSLDEIKGTLPTESSKNTVDITESLSN